MNIQEIRRAIAQAIRSGVTMPVNVYAYMPDSPKFPCIVITPGPDYRSARESFDMDPAYTLSFDLLAGAASRAEDAQILLDELLSNDTPGSIEDAIDAARTSDGELYGLAEGVVVEAATTLSPGDGNATVFAASLRLTVYTRR